MTRYIIEANGGSWTVYRKSSSYGYSGIFYAVATYSKYEAAEGIATVLNQCTEFETTMEERIR